MIIKRGKFGPFLACSGYPECRNTRNINAPLQPETTAEQTVMKCDKCGADMVLRSSKKARFWGCSNFPKCKNTKPLPMNVPCPNEGCTGEIVMRAARGRVFYGCSRYPDCTFTTAYKPVARACPVCNYPVLGEKVGKDGTVKIVCIRKKCGYEEKLDD